MASLPIRWIEVRAHCHATEDETRVNQALDTACAGDPPGRDVFEGHFGNPIVRLSRRIGDATTLRTVWERWKAAGVLASLARDVDARVDDEGILHFRLDKQAAYRGRLALARDADSIDVRVRLQAYPAARERLLAAARALVAEGA